MKRTIVSISLLLAAGCGGSKASRSNGRVNGIWQRTSGDMFKNGEVSATVDYLDLNPDGSGVLFGEFGGGVRTCAPLVYAELTANTVRLDVSGFFSFVTYSYSRSGSTLTLTPPGGDPIVFTKSPSVPPASVCGTVQLGSAVDVPSIPENFTGLAGSGGYLYYTRESDSQVLSVDPSGAAGPSFASVYPFRDVLTPQGTDFWFHIAAGDDTQLGRYTPAGMQVDVFDLKVDFGHQFVIRGAAFDAATGQIWIFARDYNGPGAALFQVNPAGEPDQLLAFFPSDAPVDSLAFHDGALWALTGFGTFQSLARIDTATATAVETDLLPQDGHSYQAIGDLGGTLYLLAQPDTSLPNGGITPVTAVNP